MKIALVLLSFLFNVAVLYHDRWGSGIGSSNSWSRHSALQRQACHWLKLWAAPTSKPRLSPGLTRSRSSPAHTLRSAAQFNCGSRMIHSLVFKMHECFFLIYGRNTKDTTQLTGNSRLVVPGQLSVNHAQHQSLEQGLWGCWYGLSQPEACHCYNQLQVKRNRRQGWFLHPQDLMQDSKTNCHRCLEIKGENWEMTQIIWTNWFSAHINQKCCRSSKT